MKTQNKVSLGNINGILQNADLQPVEYDCRVNALRAATLE